MMGDNEVIEQDAYIRRGPMLSTLASTGNIFICSAGHVSDESHQERAKRPKTCSKDSCEESSEQVSFSAVRLLFRRGWLAHDRWSEGRANKVAINLQMAMQADPDYEITIDDLNIANKL